MSATTRSTLRRLLAAACIALLAVFGAAACEDTAGTGNGTEENGGGY